MDFGVFDWILAVILIVVGLMLLTGHGDAIMGGGQASVERKKLYDDKKLQRAFGLGFLVMAAANVVTIFVKSFVVSVAYIIVIFLVIVGEVIYIKKFCKK